MKNDRHRMEKRRRRDPGQQALDSALRLLTRRDHTRRELDVKLRGRGFSAGDIERALARMDALGYLDDARTAVILAEHLVGRGYGILRIRHTLEQKGVDEAAIDKALDCCGDEAAQVLNATRVLEKRRFRLAREVDPLKRRRMAYGFLAGRGFPAMVIRQAIDAAGGDCA